MCYQYNACLTEPEVLKICTHRKTHARKAACSDGATEIGPTRYISHARKHSLEHTLSNTHTTPVSMYARSMCFFLSPRLIPININHTILVGKPEAPIECLYEDKQKKWWFAVDSNFPIMRVINERCVICYDCSLTGSNCMSIP